MKYVCNLCGWEYDEATGDPDNGLAPGTKFEDLPEDFACPLCGAGKDEFTALYPIPLQQRRRALPSAGRPPFGYRKILVCSRSGAVVRFFMDQVRQEPVRLFGEEFLQ